MSEHVHDTGMRYDESYWNERYRSSQSVWSGNPNPQLVAEIADLRPGRALGVGCGEGADTIWLAGRGWEVVAIDVSGLALERGLSHHPSDLGTGVPRPPMPELFYAAEEVAGLLDDTSVVVVNEARPRPATTAEAFRSRSTTPFSWSPEERRTTSPKPDVDEAVSARAVRGAVLPPVTCMTTIEPFCAELSTWCAIGRHLVVGDGPRP